MNTQANHARAGMDVLAALKATTDEVAPAPTEPRKRPATRPERSARRRAAKASATDAAVLTTPAAAPPTATVAPPVTMTVPAAVAVAATTVSVPAAGDQLVVRPKRGARRLAGLLLLLVVPATAAAGWVAVSTRDTTMGGAALILGALTLGLWFMRVMTVPTSVSLLGSQLEVRRGDERYTWELASPYSPVDHVRGKPGRSGWRVVMRNPDGSTFTIDGSMVPSKRFSELLARYRPEL